MSIDRLGQGIRLLAGNVAVLIVLLLVLEAGAQAVAFLYPSYEVLFLQPDRVVGWKQVPDLAWTWAGHNWYASDFSVQIHTNALGFRDMPREVAKPAGMRRVAMLGDSFVEAVQVPLERTASQILEQKLNSSGGQASPYQVLNFGISNYGVGQYLLVWREYARRFSPDYVVVFVSGLHMRRTVQKFEYGAFTATQRRQLWIRPTFTMERGSLVFQPAKDFDEFSRTQDALVKKEFNGGRSRRRHTLITLYYARMLLGQVRQRLHNQDLPPAATPGAAGVAPDVLELNLKLLETLKGEVDHAGARLILADPSRYFGDDRSVSLALEKFAFDHDAGYVPVYAQLIAARDNGQKTAWKHDGHFTDAGNVIFANSVYDWIQSQHLVRRQPHQALISLP